MLMSEMFPRKYLSGSEMTGPFKATISHTTREEVGSTREKKTVLYFREDRKPMVLNKTNGDIIALKYGMDSDDWAGAAVIVDTVAVSDPSGKTVAGLRVKIPAPKAAVAAPVETPPDDDFDDSSF